MREKVVEVIEIQVGGVYCTNNLQAACREFIEMMQDNKGGVPKIHFDIMCLDGVVRSITIRDDNHRMVVYGDFYGLPSMLEYAKELEGK